jgi:F-type H+-transporting ATPase subunit gamma
MAQLTAIKRRIKSTKNVSQITYAMQMVAASKMKKSQALAQAGQAYSQKISSALSEFSQNTDRTTHPLLKINTSPNKLVIIISSDKGLCGGLNINLFKAVSAKYLNQPEVKYVTVGKKGEGYVIKTGQTLVADFPLKTRLETISALSDLITTAYTSNEYGEIVIAYSQFINALKQEPRLKTLLPIQPPSTTDDLTTRTDFLVEPNPREVVDALLKAYVENQIKDAINQAQASEYSARMLAMKSATDSAKELMHLLTLEYNQARQEKITSEISDIVTARLSVK